MNLWFVQDLLLWSGQFVFPSVLLPCASYAFCPCLCWVVMQGASPAKDATCIAGKRARPCPEHGSREDHGEVLHPSQGKVGSGEQLGGVNTACTKMRRGLFLTLFPWLCALVCLLF